MKPERWEWADSKGEMGTFAPLRILVVDDEADTRLLLRLILEETSAEMAFASNLAGAHVCLRTHAPDLVLLDIRLGNRPAGLELCAALKGTTQALFPMVIMMTADDRPETLADAHARGANGYLVKPFTPNQILGLVDSFDVWRLDSRRVPPAFWPAPRFLR